MLAHQDNETLRLLKTQKGLAPSFLGEVASTYVPPTSPNTTLNRAEIINSTIIN